ncbi:MAG TPA: transcription-repair coupling factor [Acidimicrobiia bacterium]|nr:transcription-repair coupling factor [Acidimicrobiia bacterium]
MSVGAPLAGLATVLASDDVVRAATAGAGNTVAVPEAARALFVATCARVGVRRPVLLAVPTAAEAERVAHDLRAFLGDDAVELFPAWETLPFERVSPALETMGRRLRVMWRLRVGGEHLPTVVVAPVRALVQRLGPHVEAVEPIVVRPGDRVDRDELVERLVGAGYRREFQVEARGELAVRGSIVDVYPASADHPVRIDLWGDEVDRLSQFSVADQRSTTDLDDVWIFPARELLPTAEVRERAELLLQQEPWGREHWERLAQGATFDGMESWLPWLCPDEHLLSDLLPADALVALVEPRRLRDRAAELLDEEAALGSVLAKTWDVGTDDSPREPPRLSLPFDRLLAHTRAGTTFVLASADQPSTPLLAASAFDPVVGDSEALALRLQRLRAEGVAVFVAAEGAGSANRITQILAEEGVVADRLDAVDDQSAALSGGGVHVVVAAIDRGAVVSSAGIALVAEADLTGRRRVHRRARGARKGVDHYEGLAPNDYVVHRVHGIGRYLGMETREMFGVTRDRLVVEFRGSDRVYVDSEDIGLLRKYTGGEAPKLSKMGGAEWEKARARVRRAVRDIAAELVILYRKRLATPGHAFAEDTPFQHQVEEAFPYEETPDQLRAIEDTKADMERPVPMDRLVCGDVGFGKTEVALRAAAKAVFDGRQVAVLVPTTLLASQHGSTFRERFAAYPVRVETLSRFLSPKEQADVVAGLRDGSVDIVIGTHRLLSDDIRFKQLGLLVVDEEQRFGVQHKERIKYMRESVDVLTLSATPIPRTLELSLTGIRDLSLVNTPPEDRQPILTYVGEYDPRAVTEAIRRELLREGQVLYVHNRVHDIQHVAADVRDLVPEARVAVAHGQMDENRLEQVVTSFWEREHDVLVCTTIVESGLDMPTVNTLVVDRADALGLSQLYQLRGRVGRRGQRAYAYLLYPPDRKLTDEAYERLKTIGEFTDLGSGFKIAMRDLEIRGAGNLLGAEQSGHIAAVGFDLYMEMVTQAVDELTGRTREAPVEVQIDVPVTAHLPRDYIGRDDVRMEAYRRLAAVTTPADVDDVRDEWIDRYGPPPAPAEALLEVARLRADCVRLGIRAVSVQKQLVRFEGLELRKSQEVRLQQVAPRATVTADAVVVPLGSVGGGPAGGVVLLEALRALLGAIAPRTPEASETDASPPIRSATP